MSESMDVEAFRKIGKASAKERLQQAFLAAWRTHGLPDPTPEYRFHKTRKWRFDYAWPQLKVAVEINGGSFVQGRHNRGAALISEYDKLNEAQRLGWVVLQFGTAHMKNPTEVAATVLDVMVDVQAGRRA